MGRELHLGFIFWEGWPNKSKKMLGKLTSKALMWDSLASRLRWRPFWVERAEKGQLCQKILEQSAGVD